MISVDTNVLVRFDFADAMHLADAGAAIPLYTFDQRFSRLAADDGVAAL